MFFVKLATEKYKEEVSYADRETRRRDRGASGRRKTLGVPCMFLNMRHKPYELQCELQRYYMYNVYINDIMRTTENKGKIDVMRGDWHQIYRNE